MTDTLTIRASHHPGDLAAVDALLAASYPRLLKRDYPPSVMVLALPIISRANPGLLRSGTYYVAETGQGALVGAGGWTRGHGRTAGGDIRHVVTDHAMQRRGIARAILARVFAEARAAGVRELDCQATRTAVPFYRAMGFEELGPITVPLRPGIAFPAIRMRRRLG